MFPALLHRGGEELMGGTAAGSWPGFRRKNSGGFNITAAAPVHVVHV